MIYIYKKHNNSNTFVPVRIKLPNREEGEMFGVVTIMTGSTFLRVLCEDEVERACRIPGKMRNRVWIKDNDVVIIKKWDFEDNKADIVWRFLPLQVQRLKREGHLKDLPV